MTNQIGTNFLLARELRSFVEKELNTKRRKQDCFSSGLISSYLIDKWNHKSEYFGRYSNCCLGHKILHHKHFWLLDLE